MVKQIVALLLALFLQAMYSAVALMIVGQFGGDMAPEHQRLMIMLTGGGIAVAVAIMAVYVIVRSTKEIRKIKQTT